MDDAAKETTKKVNDALLDQSTIEQHPPSVECMHPADSTAYSISERNIGKAFQVNAVICLFRTPGWFKNTPRPRVVHKNPVIRTRTVLYALSECALW